MAIIKYQDTNVEVNAPDSVLDALENAGFKIPYSCRSGLCHSCVMQAQEAPPPSSQQGLTVNQIAQHYFLSCCCFPTSDMQVNLIGESNRIVGHVVEKTLLNDVILKLVIQADCRWFPGQFVTLWYDETTGRSYSIASRCDEKRLLEFHIKRHEQGKVSQWLHDELPVGAAINVSKPTGHCFYTEGYEESPILMVGTGTGLAPLYGIVQEALARNHRADIHMYVATGEVKHLYYLEELKALSDAFENFSFTAVVRRGAESDFVKSELIQGDVVDIVKEKYTDLKGWKVFLCGNVEMIKPVQRHCFFQGAAVTDILVDAFNNG